MLLAGKSFLEPDRNMPEVTRGEKLQGQAQPPAPPAVDHELHALAPVVRSVVAAVLRESHRSADVEDGASEALRRAVEGKARLRPGEPVRPWVLGIARHVALDILRARKRQAVRRARERAHDDGEERPPLYEEAPDPSPDPFDRFARAQEQAKIRRAMDELPQGQREALTLFHVEGLGYQEIAGRLDVPLGTVATWVARGRKAIASALREEGTGS